MQYMHHAPFDTLEGLVECDSVEQGVWVSIRVSEEDIVNLHIEIRGLFDLGSELRPICTRSNLQLVPTPRWLDQLSALLLDCP